MEKKEYIQSDNKYFDQLDLKTKLRLYLTNDHWIQIRRYLRYLRKQEYYSKKKGIFYKIISLFWARKKNTLGNKLGFFIPAFTLGCGANIYHHGSIIINGDARIGKNSTLHGMNCIGNNGITTDAPIIGDNVDIGIGAKIIGKVKLVDNIKVGANAVVTHSCDEDGAILIGLPAQKRIN